MKNILVSGGNRGIGYQVCKDLASLGHHVILTARNKEQGQHSASIIGGDIQFHALDVTNSESIETLSSISKMKLEISMC